MGSTGSGTKNGKQPDWLEPELATLTQERFSDSGWLFERKLDGERCLAFRSGDSIRLMTRNQKEVANNYPEIAGALLEQSSGDFIVDGEIVALRRQRNPLRTAAAAHPRHPPRCPAAADGAGVLSHLRRAVRR